MKFELKPKGLQISDADLLDDLRRVAQMIGRRYIPTQDYELHGRFNVGTIQRRFGSWKEAQIRAGLAGESRPTATRELLINDLQRVTKALGKTGLTLVDYRQFGMWSEQPFVRLFGGWMQALKAAGLTVSPEFRERISDQALFENMEAVWTHLGHQPSYSEFHSSISRYSRGTYCARFGGWRNALEAFIQWVSADDPDLQGEVVAESSLGNESATQVADMPTIRRPKRTPREVNQRMRFRVLQRDRFRCVACGRSPATELGLVLHVDHIVPWSRDGETVQENLQTLCQPCNLGKSNAVVGEAS